MRIIKIISTLSCLLLLYQTVEAQLPPRPSASNPALRNELLDMFNHAGAARERLDKCYECGRLLEKVRELDKSNAAHLWIIVRQYGWPGKELVGADGAAVATLLLILSDDHLLMKEMLPLVRDSYHAGQTEGRYYAQLLDTVLVKEGKPQVYGTRAKLQHEWTGAEPELELIEDQANVDKRRAEVGLPALSEYLEWLKQFHKPEKKDNR